MRLVDIIPLPFILLAFSAACKAEAATQQFKPVPMPHNLPDVAQAAQIAPVASTAVQQGGVSFWNYVGSAFSEPGTCGFTLLFMILVALIGWLGAYIAHTIGQPQIGNMIRIGSVFTCIVSIGVLARSAIDTVFSFANIHM